MSDLQLLWGYMQHASFIRTTTSRSMKLYLDLIPGDDDNRCILPPLLPSRCRRGRLGSGVSSGSCSMRYEEAQPENIGDKRDLDGPSDQLWQSIPRRDLGWTQHDRCSVWVCLHAASSRTRMFVRVHDMASTSRIVMLPCTESVGGWSHAAHVALCEHRSYGVAPLAGQ
nr:hypothetical protein CFP56_41373 [Quercus suber]